MTMEELAEISEIDAKSTSRVKLIVDDEQFEVCKETLAAESLYFASLFTHDFRDSNLSEYHVQYDFAPSVFKDFVDWMNEDYTVIKGRIRIKPCLKKYKSLPIEDLMLLLRISSIYAADNLTNDIIDLTILYHYVPAKLIPVWIAAKELGIIKLEDTCAAAFLEHQWEIPHGYKTVLHCHKNIISLKPRVPCVVAYKGNEDMGKKKFIYCWDGEKMTELTEIKIMKEDANGILAQRTGLIGMQIIATDFSIYAIGGEQGLGSGRFNNDIWRYSVITKRWYYLTSLRVPRRHMVAAVLSNKLVVAGGVGRHRCKLLSVDVLKLNDPEGIDKTHWETAAETPEAFTEVPLHWTAFGKLFILKSILHVYCPTENIWTSYQLDNERLSLIYSCTEPCVAVHQGFVYVCSEHFGDFLEQLDGSFEKLAKVFHTAGCKNKHDVIISDGRKLYSFAFCDDNIIVEVFEEEEESSVTRHKLIYKERMPDLCDLKPGIGHFSIANPALLRS